MKNRKLIFIALIAALAFLLSACKVNFLTEIKSNGSGTYIQEIGFQGDEASMAGLSSAGQDFCASQNQEILPGTSIRQETRNETETWCIYETAFKSLDELKGIYGTTDALINDISLADGKLTYNITLDLSGDSNAPMGAEMNWIVTMPGNIIEHNATSQDGNTLTWQLLGGAANDIRAVSEVGWLGGNTLWYFVGGGLLVLCCFLPLVIGGGIFFLIRRKNASPAASFEPPAAN